MTKIADIKIGARHRRDMGDLAKLADNIKTEGLLHPVGVTPENELVFGYRRLIACRDHLSWTEIDTRTVNVSSIVAGEYAENAIRKDFTVSERVAILDTIKLRKHGGDRGNQYKPLSMEKRQDENLHLAKITSPDEAVKKAGFGNTTTARHARVIVRQGIGALIEAVDHNEIAIEPGFAIALQPKDRQAEIVKLPKQERHIAVRDLPRPGRNLGPNTRKLAAKTRSPAPFVPPRSMPEYRHLSGEEAGMPPKDKLGEQHPSYPPGVNRAMAHTIEHGHIQLWPPDETARLKLQSRFTELNGLIMQLATVNWPEAGEIDRLGPQGSERVRRVWNKHLRAAHDRLARYVTAYQKEAAE